MAEDVQATNEVLIASIDKGIAGRINVRVSTFRDRDYIDIRNFYEGEGGEWLPTRKGIAVPVEFYSDLVEALATAKGEIDRRTKAAQ